MGEREVHSKNTYTTNDTLPLVFSRGSYSNIPRENITWRLAPALVAGNGNELPL
jgi:hypothetical protein